MRNFQYIGQVDVVPVLDALANHPELWDQNTLRTTHPGTAHADISDIWVWFNDPTDPQAVIDDRQTIPYPAWSIIPQLRPLVFDLMRRVEGVQLGRVIITRLPPGKRITPHVDGGAPATFYSRYQIALQNLPGSIFRIAQEQVVFATGDCWRIDNSLEHEVINNSADDRIALIVDIRNG